MVRGSCGMRLSGELRENGRESGSLLIFLSVVEKSGGIFGGIA